MAEEKEEAPNQEKPVEVVVEPVKEKSTETKKNSTTRPLGFWASIVALVLAGLYLLRSILTTWVGIASVVNNAQNNNAKISTANIVGDFFFAVFGAAGFVIVLLIGLRALKKSQASQSAFAEFGLLYFSIGLLTFVNSVTSLACFDNGWRNSYGLVASAAMAVLGIICFQRKDGGVLETEILFYIASGLATTISAFSFPDAYTAGWAAFYDVSHSIAPLAFYVLATLSVIFEERKVAK